MLLQFFKLTLKHLILIPQLQILPDLRVNIFGGNVTDIRSHTCIGQSLQRFLEVSHGRVETGYHQAVRITSDGLLQKRCQLAVSVGGKQTCLACCRYLVERRDDMAKSEQTFVDLYSLLEDHP